MPYTVYAAYCSDSIRPAAGEKYFLRHGQIMNLRNEFVWWASYPRHQGQVADGGIACISDSRRDFNIVAMCIDADAKYDQD